MQVLILEAKQTYAMGFFFAYDAFDYSFLLVLPFTKFLMNAYSY